MIFIITVSANGLLELQIKYLPLVFWRPNHDKLTKKMSGLNLNLVEKIDSNCSTKINLITR